MTHVILGHCCKDASCVRVCPQNCIRPTPEDPDFGIVEHLYIDPATCIDCSACVQACPAGAIRADSELTDSQRLYARRTRDFFADLPGARSRVPRPLGLPQAFQRAGGPLRVAVVGGGAAAMYTVRELLQRSSSIRITVFEQHTEVGGLLRTAVSSDHRGIRNMIRLFDVPFSDDRVETRTNIRVGLEVSIAALRREFDVVILAFGASSPRAVGESSIPGAHQAITVLSAANSAARQGIAARLLRGPTALIVGGGNVALDVAAAIAKRHIATRAGEPITQVVVVARSPVQRPSFTFSAVHELAELDIDLSIAPDGAPPDTGSADPVQRLFAELAGNPRPRTRSRKMAVSLWFGNEVTSLRAVGGRVQLKTAGQRTFIADSVIYATGFTSAPMTGVPFTDDGVVSNRRGRVVSADTGAPIAGLYVVGWAKRGARGGVGDNRRCAVETVERIVADQKNIGESDSGQGPTSAYGMGHAGGQR
ncbi:FAD-dependent oxidoreductase [Nocardia sp. NPDC047654]|uniref:FAD-dependent oxidoreductase n=1 Tax=Nocardia sp. NPDC047654 TaxID=3364314 RepID=UPI00372389B1